MPERTAEAELRSFIAKFDRAEQALIRAVRRAIGYSPTSRPSDSVLSIAALRAMVH